MDTTALLEVPVNPRRRPAPAPRPAADAGRTPMCCAVAAAQIGAAVLQAVAASDLYAYWAAAAWFLIGLQTLRTVLALVMIAGPTPRTLRVAAGASLAVSGMSLLVWLTSRTSGLPVGPDAFLPEPVGRADAAIAGLDLLSIVLLAAVIGAGRVRWRRPAARTWSASSAVGTVTAVGAALVLTGYGLLPAAAAPLEDQAGIADRAGIAEQAGIAERAGVAEQAGIMDPAAAMGRAAAPYRAHARGQVRAPYHRDLVDPSLPSLPGVRVGLTVGQGVGDTTAALTALSADRRAPGFAEPEVAIATGRRAVLRMANTDRLAHSLSIYRADGSAAFLGAVTPPGSVMDYPFAVPAPGAYLLRCDVYPWMTSRLLVPDPGLRDTDQP